MQPGGLSIDFGPVRIEQEGTTHLEVTMLAELSGGPELSKANLWR
jgi:hypothetical protein